MPVGSVAGRPRKRSRPWKPARLPERARRLSAATWGLESVPAPPRKGCESIKRRPRVEQGEESALQV